MAKRNRGLMIGAVILVLLGGALVYLYFHQEIISVLGGGVASMPPQRGGNTVGAAGSRTQASMPPGSVIPGEPTSPAAPSSPTHEPADVKLHSVTGRVISCADGVLVLSREGKRLSFDLAEDGKAECLKNKQRVVRVEYQQTNSSSIARRIVNPAEKQ